MKNQIIYMDNAATTKLEPEVLDEMMPYLTESYGNASSIYALGQQAKEAVENSRKTIAQIIRAKPSEVYFTSGGSESDNWALRGVAEAYQNKGRHIITSAIEHHAVLHTCQYLEAQGFQVTYVPVDENGLVSLEDVRAAIRPDTILISVMAANNEIGTIQPIKELGALAHAHGILFHTDAVQAFGHIPLDVEEMHIDLLSASAHKLNGPKGVGLLYMRKNVRLKPLIHGGQQERGKRAGTENTAGIVGFAKAAAIAYEQMESRGEQEREIRNHLIKRLLGEISHARLNGDRSKRLPNNVNVSFEFIEGESMLLMLAAKGVCASSGSACTSGSLDPSHVLLAIGLPHEKAHGSLRLSIDHTTTMEDADFVVDQLKPIIQRLRSMSPLYEDFVRAETAKIPSNSQAGK